MLLSVNFALFCNDALQKFISSQCLTNASIGISIRNADSNEIILDYNSQLSLAPASVLKLLSTASALDKIGGDYKYETQFGYNGLVVDGVLNGNIIIKGSGDPSLLSCHFENKETEFNEKLISSLKNAGIKSIKGSITGDESIFEFEGINPAWTWEDMGNYYAAGIYGINFMDNTYSIIFDTSKKGKQPQVKSVSPTIVDIKMYNNLLAKASKYDSAYIYGAPFIRERYIYGAIPQNRETFTIKGDMPEPALEFSSYITEVLKRNGISVSGSPTDARILKSQGKQIPKIEKALFTWSSPDLSKIARQCNVKSINLYAEALMRLSSKNKQPLSVGRSIINTIEYWEKKGIDVDGLFIYDGSGLSPQNKVTASFMTSLLVHMKDNNDFVGSLPVAGMEGTVKSFLATGPYKGKAKVKSGSIKNVLAYSGYLENEKKIAFTIIINGYSCSNQELRNLIGRFFEELKL